MREEPGHPGEDAAGDRELAARAIARAALPGRPPQPQLLLLFAAVLLVAMSSVSALEAARDLHGLLESARAVGTS